MSRNPVHPPPPPYGHLVEHQIVPPNDGVKVDPPRPARVTARTYSGETVTIEAPVVARWREWLCVAQPDGEAPWNAWVHRDCATPLWTTKPPRPHPNGRERG